MNYTVFQFSVLFWLIYEREGGSRLRFAGAWTFRVFRIPRDDPDDAA
ncbi:MAG: hypothetical protein MPK03_00210 [Alphaproteobacteria bacterium]|nr:hypothetical protein [Alphaproteobacteria bacterium]